MSVAGVEEENIANSVLILPLVALLHRSLARSLCERTFIFIHSPNRHAKRLLSLQIIMRKSNWPRPELRLFLKSVRA